MLTHSQRMYDQWRTREPDWYHDDIPPQPKCSFCGAFIKRIPDRTEDWEETEHCNGTPDPEYHWTPCLRSVQHDPHDIVQMAGVHEYRKCTRCGKETKDTLI